MATPSSESFDEQIESYRSISRRGAPAGSAKQNAIGWKHFAAAAGASLAGAASVDAAIIHVVPGAPIRVDVSSNRSTFVDLDGDTDYDLRVGAFLYGGGFSNSRIATAKGIGDASLVGDDSFGDFNYPVHRFAAGQVVPAVQPVYYGSYVRTSKTFLGTQTGYPQGNWDVSDTAFAGFVDGLGSSRKAGWIKIRTEGSGGTLFSIEIVEWAYQSIPGVSITVGDIGGESGVPGDFDNDGFVEADDYDEWKANYGESDLPNDNADGIVDAADYTVWRNNFVELAEGGGGLSESVPEPATISLGVLALGAAGVAALRRRRD